MKRVIWMGSSKQDLRAFPGEARREVGYQLEHVQEGVDPDDWMFPKEDAEDQSARFGLGAEAI